MIIKKKFIPFNERRLAFIDTETTGLHVDKGNEVIEIAAIIYDQHEDRVVREWSRKAVPRNIKTASPIALNMNGYNEDPKSYTDNIKDVMEEYFEVVKGCMLVGQNIQFDIKFIDKYRSEFGIGEEAHRDGQLEMKSLVWSAIKDSGIKSLSLNSLCTHFGISNEGEHRALADCKRTLEVYLCLKNINNLSSK